MGGRKLFTGQRRKDILRKIRQDGSVSVEELTERFQVSGTTIRLDLTALEQRGWIIRTHGGAVLSDQPFREPLISERVHEQEKADIAARAVAHVEDGDILLIDTGTTTAAFAQALVKAPLPELTVYSNDLMVLQTLEEQKNWNLFLLGGRVRNGFHYTCGYGMIRELQGLHFRKLFLATSAISFQEGLTTANAELALLKAAMIASAETVCLLSDSSKLHKVDFQRFAGLEEVDIMITDKGIHPAELEQLRNLVGTVETV